VFSEELMGIGFDILDFFNRGIVKTIGSVYGKRMCELGDQKMWAVMREPRMWAKEFFESQGVHHYSIDIHGQNGAYSIDLSKPIVDGFWQKRFDIVTNFGTAEHVSNQFNCWKNIHNFGKPGCVFFHVLPELGRYRPYHCNYWYDKDFYTYLMKVNGYTKVLLESILPIGHVGCCYIKPKDEEFKIDEKELLSCIHRK
jgi:hypothetical protein